MIYKLRKNPLICLFISLIGLLTGRLRISKQYLDKSIKMKNRDKFKIFRHITVSSLNKTNNECIFIVSFKFAQLSHNANKLASIIPMLLITGFPGFVTKIYAVNPDNGYWQGMYQWKSMKYLEDYKKSFVFNMMNKRAISKTIKSTVLKNQKLADFIEDNCLFYNRK